MQIKHDLQLRGNLKGDPADITVTRQWYSIVIHGRLILRSLVSIPLHVIFHIAKGLRLCLLHLKMYMKVKKEINKSTVKGM